ncbi:MAG: hypothetical protein ACTHJN_12620 [Ginsengibacter sp.]
MLKEIKKRIKGIIFNLVDKHFCFIGHYYKDKFLRETFEITSKSLKIVSPKDTLDEIQIAIIEQKIGAYMRFGDGDVFLAMGSDEMLQTNSPELCLEMKDAFSLQGPFIFKSLSIHSQIYGSEKEMYDGNHLVSNEMANLLLSFTFPFFIGCKIYSSIALHYMATYFPEKTNLFLKILKKNCLLFIGNENTSASTIKRLFGTAIHIKTPCKNAYSNINEIERDAVKYLKTNITYKVVVVAMGCSGRPLMKRLYDYGYNIFLFDFGSLLDGICGQKTRTWLEREKINYDSLLKDL